MAKELDRERKASYSIEIIVTDDGDPPLSSSTILEIVIVDGKNLFKNLHRRCISSEQI